MTAPKFTPGPWAIEDGEVFSLTGGKVIELDPIARLVFEPDRDCTAEEAAELRAIWDEQEANARLIAAAPDLYAALARLANELEMPGHGGITEALIHARAVLAKARGEGTP